MTTLREIHFLKNEELIELLNECFIFKNRGGKEGPEPLTKLRDLVKKIEENTKQPYLLDFTISLLFEEGAKRFMEKEMIGGKNETGF